MSDFPTQGCKSSHLTAAGGTLIKTGAGIFFGLTVNTGVAAATVTLYDGIDNTGAVIGIYSAAATVQLLAPMVGRGLVTGLYAVVSGTPDVTAFWF